MFETQGLPAQGRNLAQLKFWISTQEAAKRSGFSLPCVAALLDSGAYIGKVQRSEGGHCKVLAGEFDAFLAQASFSAPLTLAQARKTVNLDRLDDAPRVPRAERLQSRARADALAKKQDRNAKQIPIHTKR